MVPFEYGRIKLWKLLQKLFYIDEERSLLLYFNSEHWKNKFGTCWIETRSAHFLLWLANLTWTLIFSMSCQMTFPIEFANYRKIVVGSKSIDRIQLTRVRYRRDSFRPKSGNLSTSISWYPNTFWSHLNSKRRRVEVKKIGWGKEVKIFAWMAT